MPKTETLVSHETLVSKAFEEEEEAPMHEEEQEQAQQEEERQCLEARWATWKHWAEG